jgi:hypothetical protein
MILLLLLLLLLLQLLLHYYFSYYPYSYYYSNTFFTALHREIHSVTAIFTMGNILFYTSGQFHLHYWISTQVKGLWVVFNGKENIR